MYRKGGRVKGGERVKGREKGKGRENEGIGKREKKKRRGIGT